MTKDFVRVVFHNESEEMKKTKVLYHAISTYHIYEVAIHKCIYHRNDYSILILPDFIVAKYPNWVMLKRIFDEVYLFPYMEIPHEEGTLIGNLDRVYGNNIFCDIHEFKKIYVAGVHFYFSIFLIDKKVHFDAFEDAVGMYDLDYRLEKILERTYPGHARIAAHYGLLNISNQYIRHVICNKKVDLGNMHITNRLRHYRRIRYFCPIRAFDKITEEKKAILYDFFGMQNKKIDITDAIIIVTQNFVGIGAMSEEQQRECYGMLARYFAGNKIVIKKHPDDNIDYESIFPGAQMLSSKIPIELLKNNFVGSPKYFFSFSSTSVISLAEWYNIKCLCLDYSNEYSYEKEFHSIMKIMKKFEV